MLDELLSARNTEILGEYIKLEENIYLKKGLVTYFGNEFMLDIFTDTAERTPTFMLPPFKKYDDTVAPPSWAYVKNPLLPTDAAWRNLFGRTPRCLEWDSKLYSKMGGADKLISNPPLLDKTQILKFHIGNEEDNSRLSSNSNIAVNVVSSREVLSSDYIEYKAAFDDVTKNYQDKTSLVIGNGTQTSGYIISCRPIISVLNLIDHLAVKLVLNTISTGTMVMMGRVSGNWMNWFDVTNKKLVDRAIRLIIESCGLNYKDSCYALFETIDDLNSINTSDTEKFSPVQYTIRKIRGEGIVAGN